LSLNLKIDGFRALAHIEAGQGELISRKRNTFHGFAELATWIAERLNVESAVLDEKLPVLMNTGGPSFAIYFSAVANTCSSPSICYS